MPAAQGEVDLRDFLARESGARNKAGSQLPLVNCGALARPLTTLLKCCIDSQDIQYSATSRTLTKDTRASEQSHHIAGDNLLDSCAPINELRRVTCSSTPFGASITPETSDLDQSPSEGLMSSFQSSVSLSLLASASCR